MKKGTMPLEWLVKISLQALQIFLVVAILVGVGAIIWRSTAKQPQDQDFKAIMDAYAQLQDNFEKGKVRSGASFIVPISTEEPMRVSFYPQGDAKMPSKCKGKTCLCMVYTIDDNPKETCQVIDVKPACTTTTCGKELCAGPSAGFILTRGDQVKIALQCFTDGQKIAVTKV